MHSIDTAHWSPAALWGGLAPRGQADAVRRHGTAGGHDGGCRPCDGPSLRGTDFVRQVMYSGVMAALQSTTRASAPVPVAGLDPAEAAGQDLAALAGRALVPGGAGAQALRGAFEAGLQEAGTALQGMGMDMTAVAAMADDLRSRLEALVGAAGSSAESVAGVGARFAQKTRTELEIVTREGDVVHLSLRSRVMAAAGGVAAASGDSTASSAAFSIISGSRLEVEVEGNLNDQEMAAIRDVLAKAESLADDFFAGDIQSAFAAASAMNIDGAQLASVAIELSMKQRIEATGFASRSGSAPVTAPPPKPPAVPAPVAEPALPAVPAEAAGSEPPAGAESLAPQVPASNPAPESPLNTIAEYLSRLLQSLRDAGESGQFSFGWHAKLQVLRAVTAAGAESRDVTDNAPATAPAVGKLNEALDALA